MFFSDCVFTPVNAHSESVIINVSNSGISQVTANVVTGDTVKWRLNSSGEFRILCGDNIPGTSVPAGASYFNFTLNENSPEFIYVVKIKGEYNYKFLNNTNEIRCKIYAVSPLPVELTDFVATTIKNEVILDWSTSGEINNDRFEVQRIEITDMPDYNPENLIFNTIAVINGNGNSNEIHHYKYTDRHLKSGVFLYRLKQIDFNSNFLYHLLSDEIVIGIPVKFTLSQNFPNPFNPSTKIGFEIPEEGKVSLVLYNSAGRELSPIQNADLNAGYHYVDFNGADLPSGIYFYRITYSSPNFLKTITKKMTLLK